MFGKKIVSENGWVKNWDRREFMRHDFRFQDRLNGIVGMTVVKVIVDAQKFTMLCHDSESGKYLRVHIADSKVPYCNLRLTAVDVEYKCMEEVSEWIRKEEKAHDKEKKKAARVAKMMRSEPKTQAEAQS
jgi:hypothetical protein